MGHGAYWTLYKSRIVHMSYMYKHYINNDNLVPTIMCMFDFKMMDGVMDFVSKVWAIVESLPRGVQQSPPHNKRHCDMVDKLEQNVWQARQGPVAKRGGGGG